MKPAVLYISYDGMMEPLGQGQVVSYLEMLSDAYSVYLVSFEKPADWADETRRQRISKRLGRAQIHWRPLRYHKSPTLPATTFDLLQGVLVSLWLTVRHRVRLIHARSYLPALMGRIVAILTGAPLLFDMRGLWVDERADGGIWPRGGRLYRVAKAVERHLLRHADHVVTLTHASRREIAAFDYLKNRPPPITVIPTCADLNRFVPADKSAGGSFVVGYLGSISAWQRFDIAVAVFKKALAFRPEAEFLIVNRGQHETARNMLASANVAPDRYRIIAADHDEVPRLVAQMSCAVMVREAAYSAIAAAPTRMAELLGCGVPCLGDAGSGDVAEILTHNRVGCAMTDLSQAELDRGASELFGLCEDLDTPRRCRMTAETLFSLKQGSEDYRRIYEELVG